MADLYLDWNSDFQASATGDLQLANSDTQSKQRILRRLLTAVQGYIFHLDYGAGLPQRIGYPARAKVIEGIVKSQIALEASLDPSFPPQVSVTASNQTPGVFTVFIRYLARTGKQISLTFDA